MSEGLLCLFGRMLVFWPGREIQDGREQYNVEMKMNG